MTDIELLAAILRGDRDIAASLSGVDAEALCRGAAEHGVLPLVADRLAQASMSRRRCGRCCADGATTALVMDLARVAELKQLLRALASGGVSPLLLKGAHLAFSHYARPYLRPKPDTDLLVPPHALDAVRRIVLDLGYEPCPAIPGELVAGQATFEKRRGDRPVHTVDVHWKIFNALPFADVLTYDELAGRAVAVPSLDSSARGLSSVDALVLAAVHRIAHHFDSDRLIWLYDIDLIARGLTHEEWREFAALVRARKVAAVCRRSLQRAVDRFGTNVPAWVWTDLRPGDAVESNRPVPRPAHAFRRGARRFTHLVAVARPLAAHARARLPAGHLHARRVRALECGAAVTAVRPPPAAGRTKMAQEASVICGSDSPLSQPLLCMLRSGPSRASHRVMKSGLPYDSPGSSTSDGSPPGANLNSRIWTREAAPVVHCSTRPAQFPADQILHAPSAAASADGYPRRNPR